MTMVFSAPMQYDARLDVAAAARDEASERRDEASARSDEASARLEESTGLSVRPGLEA